MMRLFNICCYKNYFGGKKNLTLNNCIMQLERLKRNKTVTETKLEILNSDTHTHTHMPILAGPFFEIVCGLIILVGVGTLIHFILVVAMALV